MRAVTLLAASVLALTVPTAQASFFNQPCLDNESIIESVQSDAQGPHTAQDAVDAHQSQDLPRGKVAKHKAGVKPALATKPTAGINAAD